MNHPSPITIPNQKELSNYKGASPCLKCRHLERCNTLTQTKSIAMLPCETHGMEDGPRKYQMVECARCGKPTRTVLKERKPTCRSCRNKEYRETHAEQERARNARRGK